MDNLIIININSHGNKCWFRRGAKSVFQTVEKNDVALKSNSDLL